MKKIIVFLSACLLISFVGFTQQVAPEKVPATVKESFAKKFPSASYITYKMEKKDYAVAFKDNGVGMSANYNSSGEWLGSETIMIESDLPKEVLTSAATNFVGYTMTEINKIDGPDNVLNYEMKLKKGNTAYQVKFTPKGDILKKTLIKTK